MKICLAQTKPVRGDIGANLADHLQYVDWAVALGSDCIFFPELSLTGYEPSLAEDKALLPGEQRLDVFQKYSNTNKMMIGVGAPVRIDSGVGIGMFLFEPDQARKIYFKKYLHSDELPFFRSEVDFSGILNVHPRIALAICYEISVDEHLEQVLPNHPEIYLASVVKFMDGVARARERLTTIAKTHDLVCVMVNSVGEADGDICGGSTAVWDGNGSLIGQMDAVRPGILVFDTELSQVQIKYKTYP